MSGLSEAIARAARAPTLLVATDFDGTLAPIVDHPAKAVAHAQGLEALGCLGLAPQTYAAIVSGRAVEDLRARTGSLRGVFLVGGHGSQPEWDDPSTLDPELVKLLSQVSAECAAMAPESAGFLVERKPASVAVHYRNADPEHAARVVASVITGVAQRPGVHVLHGKMVIELAVTGANKGRAIESLRQRVGAATVVFIGDDATDNDAFAVLHETDVGIVVGPLESRATYRVDSVEQVAAVIAELCRARKEWLASIEPVAIEHHSLLSDQRTAALLAPSGRVVWMCAPRIDSRSIFAELLGGPDAGYFLVRSTTDEPPVQHYLGDSFLLQTKWGGVTVTDYLDVAGGRAFQRAGRCDLIRAIEGTGSVLIEFAPRIDFGRTATRLVPAPEGLIVEGAADPIVLRAPGVRWQLIDRGRHVTAVAQIDVPPEGIVLELRCGTNALTPAKSPEADRRKASERHWSAWTGTLTIPSLAPELVKRSALVLRALSYGPTGAIAAAPTTSLPEHLGGVRNWDYRYCWVRDAALSCASLVRLGNHGVAMKYLDWVLAVVDRTGSPERLRPLYTVTGDELGPEAEISELSGYAWSKPVRIGNAASEQVQLDVFGPIVDLVCLLSERGAAIGPDHWRLVRSMVEGVQARWHEPDHGIWEVRLATRHHVHSKVMCWLTLHRAVELSRELTGRERADWAELRDVIAADVLEKGWSARLNAYGAAYGVEELDASSLWVGLSGLLPPTDPRFISTVDAIQRELGEESSLMRYHYADGLPGLEGGFNLCTSWLIESLCLIGRRAEAAALFEQYCALAGATGLIPEEYHPGLKRGLGNHPQAYSHLGLINAALRLSQQ